MADTFKIVANRLHVYVALDGRYVHVANRLHAYIAQDSRLVLVNARLHAFMEGPLTPVGGAFFQSMTGAIDRGNQVNTAAGLGGVLNA